MVLTNSFVQGILSSSAKVDTRPATIFYDCVALCGSAKEYMRASPYGHWLVVELVPTCECRARINKSLKSAFILLDFWRILLFLSSPTSF